jgi:hypothetical protein
MDYAKPAPLPHELVLAVSVMRNFERNRVSVLPTTQNTMISGSGQIVNIQLPDRALLDLSSVVVSGSLTLTAQVSANTSANIEFVYPCSHHLVAQYQLLLNGGLSVSGSLDQYAHIEQEARYRQQVGQPFLNSSIPQVLENMFKPRSSNDGTILYSETESSARWIAIDNIPVCATSKYLDTSIFGKSYITLRPSNNYVLKADEISARNVQFKLDQIMMEVDVINPPTEYVEVVKELISRKANFVLPIRNTVSSIFSYNAENKLNVSSNSCDRFTLCEMATNAISTYYSGTTASEAPMFKFTFGAGVNFGSQIDMSLRVGNRVIPQTGNFNKVLKLANVTDEGNWGDSIHKNSLLYRADGASEAYSEAGYCQNNAIVSLNLAGLQEAGWQGENATLSGVNSYGLDMVFACRIADPASASPQQLLFVDTTAQAVMNSETGAVSIIY